MVTLRGRHPLSIDVVIAARNESGTVGAVVEAARSCSAGREVIVVDDGSTDTTAQVAAEAGAKVLRRDAVHGSKAEAMELGVESSDADAILFVDADCIGLTGRHLDAICEPFLAGESVMSVGWFDYGLWNPLVLWLAPTTGERVIPRWVWDAVPPAKRRGYDIEVMINEVICEGRHTTTAQILEGVTHRTKRLKFGRWRGYRETWRMWWRLWGLPIRGVVRWRTYWFYWRGLTIRRPSPSR